MISIDQIKKELKIILIEGELERVINDGFEYACLEAEHKNIPKGGKRFNKLARGCIAGTLLTAYKYAINRIDDLAYLENLQSEDMTFEQMEAPHMTREQMKDDIMRKYHSKHWHDFMSDRYGAWRRYIPNGN